MSTAHANLEDLRRLQQSVRRAQEQIEQTIKTLQRDLNGADWKDSARRDFEAKLKEASSALHQSNSRLGELTPILTRKISELSTYLRR